MLTAYPRPPRRRCVGTEAEQAPASQTVPARDPQRGLGLLLSPVNGAGSLASVTSLLLATE